MRRIKQPKIALGAVILLAFLVVGGAIWGASLDTQPPRLITPRIEMKLGDSWEEIAAVSTYPFRDVGGHVTSYETEHKPVTFVYSDPRHRLELARVQTVFFEIRNNHVRQIQLLQLGESGDWREIQVRARALAAQIERAGWTRSDPATLEQLFARRRAVYDQRTDIMDEQVLGSWHAGGARFDLLLYRTHNPGDTIDGRVIPNERFIFNVLLVRDD